MTRIVITVDVEDNAKVTIGGLEGTLRPVSEARAPSPRPPATLPPDDDGVPWPVETIEPLPLHGAATPPPRNDTPRCGIHHVDMTLRPAGVSKRTGREYRAFWGCTERDCKQTVNAA